MSRNIGIMTFHYALNHGAVLQAYALRKVLNSFPNCNAEFINYVPKGYEIPIPSDSCAADVQKKREKFNQFLSAYCGVHTPMIHSVTGNSYDIYVVGSDQVWNTECSEVWADYEYFLPNLDDKAKRIAYAASVGMDYTKINRELFKKHLSKFSAISLREKSYTSIISELAGLKCDYALDPTLLLSGSHYETLLEIPEGMKDSDTKEDPFVLYFWYDMGDEGLGGIEMVNMLARKYKLTIIHTFSSRASVGRQMLVKDGGCMFQTGIGEFLWYINKASVVITNSFHGAVLSILFKKPLYIFYPPIRKCRQENLVELLHLEDRVVQGYLSPDKFKLETDYESVFNILDKERERSVAYLENAINAI